MGTPGGRKTQILTENDPEYWYYAKIFTVWTLYKKFAINIQLNERSELDEC